MQIIFLYMNFFLLLQSNDSDYFIRIRNSENPTIVTSSVFFFEPIDTTILQAHYGFCDIFFELKWFFENYPNIILSCYEFYFYCYIVI